MSSSLFSFSFYLVNLVLFFPSLAKEDCAGDKLRMAGVE